VIADGREYPAKLLGDPGASVLTSHHTRPQIDLEEARIDRRNNATEIVHVLHAPNDRRAGRIVLRIERAPFACCDSSLVSGEEARRKFLHTGTSAARGRSDP